MPPKPVQSSASSQAVVMALQALERNDLAQADSIIQQALTTAPKHPDLVHLSGYILLMRGETAQGIKQIKLACKLAPKVALYHYNLGNAYFMQSDWLKAREALQKAVRFDPKNVEALTNLALVQVNLHQLQEAEKLFGQAAKLAPNDAQAQLNLAKNRAELGKTELVDQAIARAIGLSDLNDAGFVHEIGKLYHLLGRLDEAEAYLRKAVALSPQDTGIALALGVVLGAEEKYQAAESVLSAIPRDSEFYPEAEIELAKVYITSGEVQKGRGLLLKQQTIVQDKDLLLRIAGNLSLIGDFVIQEQILRQILKLDPGNVSAQVQLAFVPKRKLDDKSVKLLEKQINQFTQDAKTRCSMGFALGNHYRNIKQYDKAFSFYKKANRLKGCQWDKAKYQQWVDTVADIYSAGFYAQREGWGLLNRMPILIVGMPRSGTTLTEQILSSHSAIQGAGELGLVSGLSSGNGIDMPRLEDGPKAVLQLNQNQIAQLADNYLARMQAQVRHAESYVTNKLPHNFQEVGLFALLFPQAPVIHIQRDPRDNLLSIYFQNFIGNHPYAYDLKDLAFQYRQQQRLMQHWKSVVPNPVFDLQYEELVADLPGMIDKLAEFVGVAVELAMQKFYEQERQVQTASKWQVRQKLYNTSVARWKPYEKHLKPLFDALDNYK